MTLVLVLGLALAGVAFALALRAALAGRLHGRELVAHIGAYGFRTEPAVVARDVRVAEVAARLALRVGERVERRLSRERQRATRTLLDSAGLYKTSVARYLGYRLIIAGSLPAAVVVLASTAGSVSPRTILAVGGLAGLGWLVPLLLVRRRAERRIEAIDREVPELVDLLVTTVEAGVAFVAAVQLAARRVPGPLGQELALALSEQSMGLTVEESFRNMLTRIDSDALRTFVQSLLQGEQLGVSTGKILRDLAIDMRKRRRRSAEERAQKAPTKILFPLVLLILPAMFVVVLGPAVYGILQQFG